MEHLTQQFEQKCRLNNAPSSVRVWSNNLHPSSLQICSNAFAQNTYEELFHTCRRDANLRIIAYPLDQSENEFYQQLILNGSDPTLKKGVYGAVLISDQGDVLVVSSTLINPF